MLNGLINAIGNRIFKYIESFGPFICNAMNSNDDVHCARLACGLVSDLANYSDKDTFSSITSNFMDCLNKVLRESEYETETKLHAIIAVGDICLATEE